VNTEKLFEVLYGAKALVNVYSGYSKSSPKSELERKGIQKEMKAIKEALSGNLAELKRMAKKLESEVKPG
jgi:hypothetical protein